MNASLRNYKENMKNKKKNMIKSYFVKNMKYFNYKII